MPVSGKESWLIYEFVYASDDTVFHPVMFTSVTGETGSL